MSLSYSCCRARGLARVLVAAALLSSLAVSSSFAAAPAPAPAPATVAPPSNVLQAAAESAKKAPEIPKLEPPDGKWLRDEQGRQYFLYEVPRYEGHYRWENDEHTRVRLSYGLVYDVASSDEKKFVLKLYRPSDESGPVARAGLSDVAKAQIAAQYKFETPEARRLTLAPFGKGLPNRGQWRNGVALADMDGDGNLDVVHGPFRKGGSRPNLFLGDGQGVWKFWQTHFPSTAFDYGDVAVADLNGDGHQDVVLASHLLGIVALIGDGKGNFEPWTSGIEFRLPNEGSETEAPFTSRAIAIGDMDGDGRPDIVALGEGPRMAASRDVHVNSFSQGARGIRIYLNQGNGSWKVREEGGKRLYGDSIRLADVNGDGRLDIVTGSSTQGLSGIVQLSRADGGMDTLALQPLRANAFIRSVAVADFNHDGRPDLAIGYLSQEGGVWRTGIDVYFAQAASTPAAALTWERRALINEESLASVTAMDTGDLNGDGAPDLVAATGDGRVWVFVADGKGWFTREPQVAAGVPGCSGSEVRIGAIEKGGLPGLLLGFAGETGSGEALASVMNGAGSQGAQCPNQGALQAWKVSRVP